MCFFYFLLGMFSIIFFLSLSLGHVPKVGKKQSEIILLWEVLLTLKVQAEFWLVYFYLEMFCSGTKSRLYFYLQRKKKSVLIKYLSLWWLKVAPKLLRGMRNYLQVPRVVWDHNTFSTASEILQLHKQQGIARGSMFIHSFTQPFIHSAPRTCHVGSTVLASVCVMMSKTRLVPALMNLTERLERGKSDNFVNEMTITDRTQFHQGM